MGVPWDGIGMNCYEMGWMRQKNMSHGQTWKLNKKHSYLVKMYILTHFDSTFAIYCFFSLKRA